MCLQGVVMFSITLFFSKLVSYTFMDWLPYYITNTAIDGTYYNTAQSAYLATLFDVGGIAGSSNCVSLYPSLSCDYYRSHCCRVSPRSHSRPCTGMLNAPCDFRRHGLDIYASIGPEIQHFFSALFVPILRKCRFAYEHGYNKWSMPRNIC